MRRRDFLLTPLLLPALARAADDQPSVRYPDVIPGVTLNFPRDHGAHPDFRTEWWYVTGALQTLPTASSPAQELGFQLTFFRTRPGQAEDLASPIAARQVLFAHAAVSRPGVGLQHAERAARNQLGGGYSTADCEVFIGNWQMKRSGSGAQERLQLSVHDAAFAFEFTLTPTQPLLLQGDNGYSQKGRAPRQASYYVSWPQLEVSGNLVLDGRRQPA
ncbi:MAG TPA: carotenoid 1,2-hydratase, partial [Rhodocyclaceae bacterium]|nr:carotenoid 1,2-hydratase [Rhodocyclaceae bacterium]